MHDPMVVAFDIRRPWPSRSSGGIRKGGKRWHWQRHGAWWKPGSWSPFVTAFGRQWYFPSLITIWHNEPGGRDSFEICKRSGRWRWHVWHWSVQIRPLQTLKRFLFERCEECGRRYPWGYAPVSHQWDAPGSRWFRVERRAFHYECSSLVHLRRGREGDERLIRHLFAAYRLGADLGEAEALANLTDPRNRTLEFLDARRLTLLLGYDRDDGYDLVRSGGVTDEPQEQP